MIPIRQVLTDSWAMLWRYRLLWLFAFLSGGGMNLNVNEQREFGEAPTPVERYMFNLWTDQRAMIISLVVLGAVVSILWLIVSIASNGGMTFLTREAAYGRPVAAKDGFRVGFHLWWRTVGWGLLIVLMMLPLVLIVGVTFLAPCAGLVIALAVLIAFLVLGPPWLSFSWRYLILADMPVTASFGAGYRLVAARLKTSVLFSLALLGVSLVVMLPLWGLAAGALYFARNSLSDGDLAVTWGVLSFAWLVLLMPTVWLRTYQETAWTLAFENIAHAPVEPIADQHAVWSPEQGAPPAPPAATQAGPPAAEPPAPPAAAPPAPPEPPAPDA